MTDKELIEMAAKAAGYDEITFTPDRDCGVWSRNGNVKRIFWNPLTDDADAFRLANKVQLTVYHAELAVVIKHKQYSWDWLGEGVNEDTGDRDASTRRAITRAAAQIGKDME